MHVLLSVYLDMGLKMFVDQQRMTPFPGPLASEGGGSIHTSYGGGPKSGSQNCATQQSFCIDKLAKKMVTFVDAHKLVKGNQKMTGKCIIWFQFYKERGKLISAQHNIVFSFVGTGICQGLMCEGHKCWERAVTYLLLPQHPAL